MLFCFIKFFQYQANTYLEMHFNFLFTLSSKFNALLKFTSQFIRL